MSAPQNLTLVAKGPNLVEAVPITSERVIELRLGKEKVHLTATAASKLVDDCISALGVHFQSLPNETTLVGTQA